MTPYCVVEGCPKEAIGKRPVGVTSDGIPIVELVCEEHEARTSELQSSTE